RTHATEPPDLRLRAEHATLPPRGQPPSYGDGMPLVRRSGSRALVAAAVAIVCAAVVGPGLAVDAHAQSSRSASDLRPQADALSTRYFAALARVQSLVEDIALSQE